MPIEASPLRIAILGPGRIGSAYAFQLARVGRHDVTVVARPGSKRLQQLERDDAIIDSKGNRAAVQIASSLDESIGYDLVIVTVLAHQLDVILPVLRRSSAKHVLFMVNMFDPERLQTEVGAQRCAFGMQFIQANLTDDGRLSMRISAAQKIIISHQALVDVFKAAGLPATLELNMTRWLRSHVPICVAIESVCVTGARCDRGASWRDASVVGRGVRESFQLIEGLGYDIYPRSKKRLAQLPLIMVTTMLWSVSRIKSFRDLLATAEAECCALVHTMVEAAPSATQRVAIASIEAMKPAVLPR